MAAGDRRFILHFDWTLFILVLALSGIGLVSVISASYAGAHRIMDPLVIRQLIWIAAGTAAMLLAVLANGAGTAPSRLVQPHYYAFGGVMETAQWLRHLIDGTFTMDASGEKFTVNA